MSGQKVSTVRQILPHPFIRLFPLYHPLLPPPSFSVTRSICPSPRCLLSISGRSLAEPDKGAPAPPARTVRHGERAKGLIPPEGLRGRRCRGGRGCQAWKGFVKAVAEPLLPTPTLHLQPHNHHHHSNGWPAPDATRHPPLKFFFRLWFCRPPCGPRNGKKKCDRCPAGSYSHTSPCLATLAFSGSPLLSASFFIFKAVPCQRVSFFARVFVCVEVLLSRHQSGIVKLIM